MTFWLYPRLPVAKVNKFVSDYSSKSIGEIAREERLNYSEGVTYAPTGGNKIGDKELKDLRHKIVVCAKKHGYPEPAPKDARRKFDIECGAILYDAMHIYPAEACRMEVWAYITCILTPDIVLWRFPMLEKVEEDDENVKPNERFLGSDRGLRRNTFGRLWWRAYLFYKEDSPNHFELLEHLTEDEIVQLTERNSLAASPQLIRSFAEAFLVGIKRYADSSIPDLRRNLIRESTKRLRRRLPMIAFEILDDSTLRQMLDEIIEQTALALQKSPPLVRK